MDLTTNEATESNVLIERGKTMQLEDTATGYLGTQEEEEKLDLRKVEVVVDMSVKGTIRNRLHLKNLHEEWRGFD